MNRNRRRVARRGDNQLTGIAVTDDRNSPTTLVMQVDGLRELVVIDTHRWMVLWETPHTAS